MYLRVYLIKVLLLSSIITTFYHHMILFCRPGLPRQEEFSKLLLWLNICLGITLYYHITLMLTRKISKTMSLNYYYLLWWLPEAPCATCSFVFYFLPLLRFYISLDLLSLLLFSELVLLLFYFYRYRPISLFKFYVIILLLFLWTIFLLNPSQFLHCIASWFILDCIKISHHQLHGALRMA